MSGAPGLTHLHRLGPGRVLSSGSDGSYRSVELIDGERHAVISGTGRAASGTPEYGRALLSLAHVTDLQLADVQSPTRFEFLNRGFGDPRYRKIIPVQRPQEALTAHAIEATIRTINALSGAPVTGAPLELVVTTGDAIDNAQWNEVQAFMALFDGGGVHTDSGAPGYEGVQSPDWPDDIYWKPDGGPDWFRDRFGFPTHPGLLELAMRDFEASGLRLPWLGCFGNHEALNQGVGAVTPVLAAALVGDRKPVRLPHDFDHDRVYETFIDFPEEFFRGEVRAISPDPDRRPVTRREFVEAHFRAGARPFGHGFTAQNLTDGTAYYVHDTEHVRLVCLDTACIAGGADGCVDLTQARWLEQRLTEVHSRHLDAEGSTVETGNPDRLVVLFSHHGIDTLDNSLGHDGPDAEPLLGGEQLTALVHRFPNVVLWLDGHTHTNSVRFRPAPAGGGGFWEVTTCAVVDWPCQTRIVELVECPDGSLSIVCTMLDHGAPLGPGELREGADIAGLHREIAANVPWAGFGSPLAGAATDRNVELRLAAPFDLAGSRR